MNTFLTEAQSFKDELTAYRRHLHSNAEVGFALNGTKAFVKEKLTEMGYAPRDCGKAGVIALAGNKKGKVFMIRADMDALPVKEEAEVDFKAENGNMHGCGHDMHTAMLLGAAKLLKAHESEINGTVKLMFQPAEETFEGSADMIKNGLLEAPKVDAALMIHVMAGIPFKAGTAVVSSPGVSAPAADYFEIKIQGKGCHGSSPNMGVDPINIAAHILIALQEINSRELSLHDSAALTVGRINGGSASNAIPDAVTMGGTLRTFDEEVRGFVKKRLVEISKAEAEVFRGSAEVSFTSGCPTLVNDKSLSELAEKYTRELLGNEKTFSVAQLNAMSGNGMKGTSGSEDFAYVSHEVPSIMLALAAGEAEKGYIYGQHHPKVRFDEDALPYGSAVYAWNAVRWLEEKG